MARLRLPIGVYSSQAANPWWSASGQLRLRCGSAEEIVSFQDRTRRHQLPDDDWAKARMAFAP
jgi:hypothetical protein